MKGNLNYFVILKIKDVTGVDSASNRNQYQGYLLGGIEGGKGGL